MKIMRGMMENVRITLDVQPISKCLRGCLGNVRNSSELCRNILFQKCLVYSKQTNVLARTLSSLKHGEKFIAEISVQPCLYYSMYTLTIFLNQTNGVKLKFNKAKVAEKSFKA